MLLNGEWTKDRTNRIILLPPVPQQPMRPSGPCKPVKIVCQVRCPSNKTFRSLAGGEGRLELGYLGLVRPGPQNPVSTLCLWIHSSSVCLCAAMRIRVLPVLVSLKYDLQVRTTPHSRHCSPAQPTIPSACCSLHKTCHILPSPASPPQG